VREEGEDTNDGCSERFAEGYALLQAGNAAYTAGRYAAAAKVYQAAMDVLQDSGVAVGPATTAAAAAAAAAAKECEQAAGTAAAAAADDSEAEEGLLLWLKCSLNLACCHFRLGHYRQCVAQCDGLLEGGCGCWVGLGVNTDWGKGWASCK
jgi:tetratricopeptide (TPR) repeat protein